jgi:hypothetical protein
MAGAESITWLIDSLICERLLLALGEIQNRQRLRQVDQEQMYHDLKIRALEIQVRSQRLTPWWILIATGSLGIMIGLWTGINLPAIVVCSSETSVCSLFRSDKRTITYPHP